MTKSGVISYSDASCITGNTGAKGDKGIPGINGENGKTTYLHIAYANSADGTSGFSTNDSTNKLYIGQYIDFIEEDSTLPSAYQWTKIKGDTGAKGDKGDQGVKALQPTRNWTGTFTTIGMVQGAVIGDFNRTPVVGDVFLNLDGSSNTGTWEVTAISGTNVSIKLLAYVKSKGADGKNGSSVTITSKSVTYQTSVSGVTVPSGTWNKTGT